MTDLFVEFYSLNKTEPFDSHLFIHHDRPTEFKIDGDEGTLTFDGYFYVENHPPPYPEDENLPVYERPYRHSSYLPKLFEVYTKSNSTDEEHFYKVEVYKKVVHKSTDRMSTIEDDDGSEMRVCFNPTNLQTLHFKLLETLK